MAFSIYDKNRSFFRVERSSEIKRKVAVTMIDEFIFYLVHKKQKNLDKKMKTPRLLNFRMTPLIKDANKTLHNSNSI